MNHLKTKYSFSVLYYIYIYIYIYNGYKLVTFTQQNRRASRACSEVSISDASANKQRALAWESLYHVCKTELLPLVIRIQNS